MLRFEGVRKSYGARVAVEGLDLEVRPGEVFGLLGPNGAGKGTTVSLALGLLAPDAGRVAIGSAGTPADPAVRARVGVAPQALALYERLTGIENLTFFGRIYGLCGARLAERTAAALDFVGLSDRKHDPASAYSGGMNRRLNLTAAVLHEPDLLLLDEPTTGVDPQSRNAIFDNVRALRARGRTIVYTTHNMEEAERLCDRVGILDQGKLLALDTVPRLLRAHGGAPTLIADVRGTERRIETTGPLKELARLSEEGCFAAGVRAFREV